MPNFDPYDSIVPVFHSNELPKRFRQIGTAIFTEINGDPFLLTAAHVTDELKSGELLVPTSQGLSPIEGYVAYIYLPPDIPRGTDTVDIAYYRLTARFASELSHRFTPFPQRRSRLITSAHELAVCSVSGYPASKSKKKNDGSFTSEIFSFRGGVAAEAIYQQLGFSSTENIIVHFHKKRATDPQSGKAFPTPGLNGISGGAIFAWPHGCEVSDDWSLPELVGIVHTFKEKEGLIIGTTFLPIVAAIGLGRMKNFSGP